MGELQGLQDFSPIFTLEDLKRWCLFPSFVETSHQAQQLTQEVTSSRVTAQMATPRHAQHVMLGFFVTMIRALYSARVGRARRRGRRALPLRKGLDSFGLVLGRAFDELTAVIELSWIHFSPTYSCPQSRPLPFSFDLSRSCALASSNTDIGLRSVISDTWSESKCSWASRSARAALSET